MLKPAFLSAEILGLAEEEREAAIKVLGSMERGEITYHSSSSIRPYPRRGFNMKIYYSAGMFGGCLACWGGLVAMEMGMASMFAPSWLLHHGSLGFKELCFEFVSDDVSVERAAEAGRNFLTLGSPLWQGVMGRKPIGLENRLSSAARYCS